jgi:signal transduction histidine kinase
MTSDFPRLVSLACHDLRTPLATVHGFAKTILRQDGIDETTARWLGMIDAATEELVGLLDQLSLAARIESDRYEPVTREADSLELARAAVPAASGEGTSTEVDVDVVVRSLAALARAASRHGGVEVTVHVRGAQIEIAPVVPEAAPIVLGEELKDLGAAVAVRCIRALGGGVELGGERLLVTLPPSSL